MIALGTHTMACEAGSAQVALTSYTASDQGTFVEGTFIGDPGKVFESGQEVTVSDGRTRAVIIQLVSKTERIDVTTRRDWADGKRKHIPGRTSTEFTLEILD